MCQANSCFFTPGLDWALSSGSGLGLGLLGPPSLTLWAGFAVKDSVLGGMLISQEVMLPKRAVRGAALGQGRSECHTWSLGHTGRVGRRSQGWGTRQQNPSKLFSRN